MVEVRIWLRLENRKMRVYAITWNMQLQQFMPYSTKIVSVMIGCNLTLTHEYSQGEYREWFAAICE